jgi:hypothetical protein
VFYGCTEIEGSHLLLGGKRRYDGPHGVLMEDSSEAELLKAELLSRQVHVLEGTRHSSRRPLKHGAAEDRRLRRWRQVRGLLRVSLSRGYSGCRPILSWAGLVGRSLLDDGGPNYDRAHIQEGNHRRLDVSSKEHLAYLACLSRNGNRLCVTLGPSGVYINQRV